jgi:hypothetical protein
LEIAFFIKLHEMSPYKVNIINMLQLLASVEEQDDYKKNVPIADVAAELINGWFDDSFFPEKYWIRELFSNEEWGILMDFHHFYDSRIEKLPDTYEELRENFAWKEIVGKANWALDMLRWREIEAKHEE